jgi:hypothetical protein
VQCRCLSVYHTDTVVVVTVRLAWHWHAHALAVRRCHINVVVAELLDGLKTGRGSGGVVAVRRCH